MKILVHESSHHLDFDVPAEHLPDDGPVVWHALGIMVLTSSHFLLSIPT